MSQLNMVQYMALMTHPMRIILNLNPKNLDTELRIQTITTNHKKAVNSELWTLTSKNYEFFYS
jgi:hypothetical protein